MTPDDIVKLIRPELQSLGGYSAHTSPETLAGKVDVPAERIIKLDANENPYGCSPRVPRALSEYQKWSIYPDAAQARLRRQLQGYVGVDASRIVAACGSGELLDDILCLFIRPGDEVINCIPTFDMYRTRTIINGAELINVPRDDNYAVEIGAVKAAITPKTKLIILANPNSPTGTVTTEKDISTLLETGVPVLVDEAYYEFCGKTVVPLVDRYPNLMVLRTFSKWAGLAGLRVGYGIFPPEIASYLIKIKLPYNVSVAALVAVQESLEDVDYLMEKVKAIIAERERLFQELRKIDWLKPFPSQANFIFCSVQKGDAGGLRQRLQQKGILVRYFDQPLLQNSIRISVGRPEDTDTLVKVLQELGEEING
ncbi:MAG: histidinol-phosphate transaminase [Dehalococcoidales bacterium]|nr:histidinol-phosphate transaminase [Dehalococcoidales bacterium]